MNKYTFFFVLNNTLLFENADETAIEGKSGYKILKENCEHIETVKVPETLEIEHVRMICHGKLFKLLFEEKVDPYQEYYQSWIWDHQKQNFD
jgi:hypothetical protein